MIVIPPIGHHSSSYLRPVLFYIPDMTRRAVCLQHVPFEGPGVLAHLLESQGIELTSYLVPQKGLPSHHGDLLIIMGGPMSANDSEEWIEQETRFIKQAIQDRTAVIGICLGSQLMAKALGAEIRPGRALEIGMTSITVTTEGKQDPIFRKFPPELSVFEWHGEIFDLPSGAVALARSALAPVQAFRYGSSAYGLLFHLEMEQTGIQMICRECPRDVTQAGLTPSSILEHATSHLPQLHTWAKQLLDHLLSQNR